MVNDTQPFTRIHAFWLNEAAVWSVQLGKHFHLPVTATAMGQDVLAANSWLKKTEIRQLTKIVTLSPFHQQELLQQTGLTSEMIPWGLPPNTLVNEERTIDLIGVGNLIPLKDYAYFLQVCEHLKKRDSGFQGCNCWNGPGKNTPATTNPNAQAGRKRTARRTENV